MILIAESPSVQNFTVFSCLFSILSAKESICNTIRFQESANDAVGFWFLFTVSKGGSIQTLVCRETIFVFNNFKKS